jgi:mycothiol synthase
MINHQPKESLRQKSKANGKQPVKLTKKDNQLGDVMILEKAQTKLQKDEFIVRPTEMRDLEKTVDLFHACSLHMIGKKETSLSDVRSEWLLPDFDLETATRVVLTPKGKVVGYIEVWDVDQTPVRVWVWGRVHPNYEGLGIGTYLMDWAEERARQAIKRVPDDLQVAMESGSFSTYEPAHELFRDRGMEVFRHFYTMATDLDSVPVEPQWPDGLNVRNMRGEEEARDVIWVIRDAFRDHWGYVEQPFEEEYRQWLHFIRHDELFDPSLWFLAIDGDEIAGLSLCKPKSYEDPDMGWVQVLGVRRPWRKRGLGLALLQHSFREFYSRGKSRVGLGVDASSLTGATRLYEKAGMKPIRQFTVSQKVLRPGRDIATRSVD